MILETLFADDYALMAQKDYDLQFILDKSVEASHLFGLTISLGRTEVSQQPAPGSTAFHLKDSGTVPSPLEALSPAMEISARTCKANQALEHLCT